jgi:hypothetical protein
LGVITHRQLSGKGGGFGISHSQVKLNADCREPLIKSQGFAFVADMASVSSLV